jgi:hypothetical protein
VVVETLMFKDEGNKMGDVFDGCARARASQTFATVLYPDP